MSTAMSIHNAPNLVSEDYGCRTLTPILDVFLKNREIMCLGKINSDSATSLILQLKLLQMQDPSAPITLHINSAGGNLQDALAVYDVMRSLTCPIETICMRMAASSAMLLFVAGQERKMLPHSRLFLHDPSLPGGDERVTVPSMIAQLKLLTESKCEYAEILAECTGVSVDCISEKMKKETSFDVYEAVTLGLATGSIGNEKDLRAIFERGDKQREEASPREDEGAEKKSDEKPNEKPDEKLGDSVTGVTDDPATDIDIAALSGNDR